MEYFTGKKPSIGMIPQRYLHLEACLLMSISLASVVIISVVKKQK